MQATVNTVLYCAPNNTQENLDAVIAYLEQEGWTVDDSTSTQNFGLTGTNSWLAESNPITLVIEKDSATDEDARAAVSSALHATGNYSLVGAAIDVVSTAAGDVQTLIDDASNLANHPKDLGVGIGVGLGTVLVVTVGLAALYAYYMLRRR